MFVAWAFSAACAPRLFFIFRAGRTKSRNEESENRKNEVVFGLGVGNFSFRYLILQRMGRKRIGFGHLAKTQYPVRGYNLSDDANVLFSRIQYLHLAIRERYVGRQ